MTLAKNQPTLIMTGLSKEMMITQNPNCWMNLDGSPLQGKLVAGLIKKKDQGLIMI